MKLLPPRNSNYAAVVVLPRQSVKLPGLDNLVGFPIHGYQALSDLGEGKLYILFGAETQLSEEYCRMNNLHRHAHLNDDPSKTGYLEDNRRVKAIKLRGNRSDALLMPLDSLRYIKGVSIFDFDEGDTFDSIDGHEICRKYVLRQHQPGMKSDPASCRFDEKFLPRHFETDNYFRNSHRIPDQSEVVITQKLHGTSLRVGNIPVERKLRWWEKVARKFGVKVSTTTYELVAGSRNVLKDITDSRISDDIYVFETKKLEGRIPKGFILYGETSSGCHST